MRLPPSELINDRLLNAVDNFYKPPTHETPRNAYVTQRDFEEKATSYSFQ